MRRNSGIVGRPPFWSGRLAVPVGGGENDGSLVMPWNDSKGLGLEAVTVTAVELGDGAVRSTFVHMAGTSSLLSTELSEFRLVPLALRLWYPVVLKGLTSPRS